MADDPRMPPHRPTDWASAFAEMPLESPPQDVFAATLQRLSTAETARRPARPQARLAAVAAVVGIVAIGLLMVRSPKRDGVAAAEVAAVAIGKSAALRPSVVEPQAAAAHHAPTETSSTTLPTATPRADFGPSPVAPPGRRVVAQTRAAPRSTAEAATRVRTGDPDGVAIATPATPALDGLRAESAQLEALAAYARDDRVASAPAMVLAAEAEDRLRLIDAVLSQPGLGDAQVLDLWTRRVAALRELAGVEGTGRWLAANGESLQGALALID